MKKEITIEVPNDYSAITLRKYLKMSRDLETFKSPIATGCLTFLACIFVTAI